MEITEPFSRIENYVNHFTAQFTEDSVVIGNATVPLGQVCVDMLNVDDELLLDIETKAKELQSLADEKIFNPDFPIDIALAIELKLAFNALIKLIIKLPLYKHLEIPFFSNQNMLAEKKDVESLKKMAEPGSKENIQLQEFIKDCLLIPADIHCFQYICGLMADYFFEKISKRDAGAYARQLLKTDFHKTLMLGRAPRRCQNCGKFFLLENGYNIKYCGRVAPGETARTCRVVGAHNKASKQAGKTPIQNEYQRTYDRLKKRKANGKISAEEWNRQVAYIQAVKDKVETGQMDEFEGTQILRER